MEKMLATPTSPYANCKEIQLKLIEDAYEMLNDNGYLLYSTCSFSIQENEEVIIEFLNKHPDMKIIDIITQNKLFLSLWSIT